MLIDALALLTALLIGVGAGAFFGIVTAGIRVGTAFRNGVAVGRAWRRIAE